jgi:hypothetical protein
MNRAGGEHSMRTTSPVTGILAAGGAAGALDILAAFATTIARGHRPVGVLKAIASGLLGPDAFSRGNGVAALGLFLHFFIATGWAAIYWLLSRRFPVLVRRPVPAGALYGIAVFWLMRLVVVPLSAAPDFSDGSVTGILRGMAIHITCVGLPIALVLSRAARAPVRALAP